MVVCHSLSGAVWTLQLSLMEIVFLVFFERLQIPSGHESPLFGTPTLKFDSPAGSAVTYLQGNQWPSITLP